MIRLYNKESVMIEQFESGTMNPEEILNKISYVDQNI